MTTILLADDHLIFREGIRSQLSRVEGMQVVAEAPDGRRAVKLAEKVKPDVALLDISMPVLNGIEATRQILKAVPGVKVIILSMYGDRQYIIEALKAGASGYMLKEQSFEQLVSCIRTVLKGMICLGPNVDQTIVKDYVRQLQSQDSATSNPELSGREREVLQLIAEGRTSKDIANTLCVSSTTVDTHRKNIMRKLDIHTTAGLVKYAIQYKIIALE